MKVGAYEVIHELKSGGMGAVLLGRRRGPGTFEQLVAIKLIRAELAGAANVRAMFLDEAAILARLNHPAVATVHDFGDENGALYMVMEYVAGIPFRDMAELQPPPGVIARAIAEACRGLHAAHELRDLSGNLMGLVHRDISPDNLLLGFDGHVKVIDFGIALVKNRQSPVTEYGTVKGKPPYMSPEQVKNEAMDRRSDVFSLAVVMHEMLTGKPLFDGDSIYAIARAVEHMEIRPPSLIRGDELPPGLDAAVMSALERDLSKRTPTAAAFAEQLEHAIGGSKTETLEAWAERQLWGARETHREWLAQIISGRDGTTLLGVGRLGKTELAPLASADTVESRPAAPAAPSDAPDDPTAATRVDAATEDDLALDRPKRSLAVPILLACFVLGIAGGGIYFMTRKSEPTAKVVPPADGAIAMVLVDAPAPTTPTALDADLATPTDAAAELLEVPVDAGRRPALLDAGTRPPPRDAAIASAPADAAAAPEPTGTGLLNVKHNGDAYVTVVLDGKVIGTSPIFRKKLPAGKHTVELLDAKSGDSVHKVTITVEDGKELTVRP